MVHIPTNTPSHSATIKPQIKNATVVLRAIFFIVLVASLSGAPAASAQALHSELLAPVQRCVGSGEVSNACLSVADGWCINRLNEGNSIDPFVEAFCTEVENDALEAARLDAESKLAAGLSKLKEVDVLASVEASRKTWEGYRDAWCEDEGRTAPTGLTGQADLARETCRQALTLDRLFRLRRMIGWLTP
jgi:hypothetical protein